MEKVSIWDAVHPVHVETKEERVAKVYLGYSRYCLDLSAEYGRRGDAWMAEWYHKEAMEYVALAEQLRCGL